MRVYWLAGFLACAGASAQSVSLSLDRTPGATEGSVLMKLEAPADASLVAMQWTFVFPGGFTVKAGSPAIGDAVKSAGKSVTCVAKKRGGGSEYDCILAGGKSAIPNGVLATVRFGAEAAKSSGSISAEKITGVTADAASKPIASVAIALK